MKSECKQCIHFKENKCDKNLKNGYNNCKKFKSIPIEQLQKEYKQLLQSKNNPERLKYLKEKLETINGYL